jgi:hypothetical protein
MVDCLREAFNPQAVDVLEMPAVIGEESGTVLAGRDAKTRMGSVAQVPVGQL